MKLLLVAIIVNIFVLVIAEDENRVCITKSVRKLGKYLQQKGLEGRIIDGEHASLTQFPWQAGIRFKTSHGDNFCGGTLINDEWILTAAHCVIGVAIFEVRLGTIYSNGGNDKSLQTISAGFTIYHPEYDPINRHNDIALIRLSSRAKINQYVRPIPLDSCITLAGTNLTFSGYGAGETGGTVDERLKHVTLLSITNHKCREIHGGAVTDDVICTLGMNVESPCHYDDGGPLVRYINGYARHVGILSYVSHEGCNKGIPAVYLRTSSYRHWIRSITGV